MTDNHPLSVKETLEQLESPGTGRRLKPWLFAGAMVLALLILVFWWTGGKTSGTPSFQTRPVQSGDLVITVTATGNLAATNEVEIGSELSGIITRMTADFNDTVKVNQPLVYLDDTKVRAAVMQARAEVAAARANLKEAFADSKVKQQALKRLVHTHELTQGKMPSARDLEQAEADFEQSEAAVAGARAAIEKAEAALKLDEADLSKTVIYSPVNGIVLKRQAEVGQTVAASLEAPVLYTLAEDLRQMELQVDVDEADVGLVHEGQQAVFTVDAYPDKTFQAEIRQVRYGAEITEDVVTYKTVLRVENPDLLLRPGMTATADITVKRIENTLLVPNAALRFTPPESAENPKQEKKSLVSYMLPRPPGRQARKNMGEASGPVNGKPSRVWILKDHVPAPVAVEITATDGALTAIKSSLLEKDMEVIVNAVAAGK
jgi:HlyD family secretion protein